MDCLYEAFVARGFMGGRLTLWPSSLEYLCSNTTEASSSALRRFFLDVLTANFGNPDRIKGTTEEWDKVLANHDDARTCLKATCSGGRLSGQRVISGLHVDGWSSRCLHILAMFSPSTCGGIGSVVPLRPVIRSIPRVVTVFITGFMNRQASYIETTLSKAYEC